MEIERDEMFRLMSVRVSQWKAKTRMASIATAGMGGNQQSKSKPGVGGGADSKPKPLVKKLSRSTPANKKPELVQPMMANYDYGEVEEGWY